MTRHKVSPCCLLEVTIVLESVVEFVLIVSTREILLVLRMKSPADTTSSPLVVATIISTFIELVMVVPPLIKLLLLLLMLIVTTSLLLVVSSNIMMAKTRIWTSLINHVIIVLSGVNTVAVLLLLFMIPIHFNYFLMAWL